MVRSQRGSDNLLRKGPWSPQEDMILVCFIGVHGLGQSWNKVPRLAGLLRSGQSCRLRWNNYLRPDIKRGKFSMEEESIIIRLHAVLGNRWSTIANHLPGRSNTEIKNFYNTHLRKKLLRMGIDPTTHTPTPIVSNVLLSVLRLLGDFTRKYIDLKQLNLDPILGPDFDLGQKIVSEHSAANCLGLVLDWVQKIDSEPSVGNGLGLGLGLDMDLDLISWPIHPGNDSEPSVGNSFMFQRNSLSPSPCKSQGSSDGDSDSRYIEVFTRILRRGRG